MASVIVRHLDDFVHLKSEWERLQEQDSDVTYSLHFVM